MVSLVSGISPGSNGKFGMTTIQESRVSEGAPRIHGNRETFLSKEAIPTSGPVLQTFDITKSYGTLQAVGGVDISLYGGRITGLIGPNGAGKTTLLNLISHVEKPTSGSIHFLDHDIATIAPHALAERGLVRTFQISRDLGRLTVLENMLLARPRQSGESLFKLFLNPRLSRHEEAEAIEKARELLMRVDLWRLADAPAATLSGGQKKLLEVTRALMIDPVLILLDEPAAGVAPAMEEVLIEAVRALASDGVGVVIVEHDLDVVSALCDDVYVMANGVVLTQGSFDEVTADTRVVEAYLGLKK